MPIVTLTATAPRSVNKTAGSRPGHAHRLKRRLQLELAAQLIVSKVPRPIPGDRAYAAAVIAFPVYRLRDEGNYRAPLEKALGDALVPKPSKRDLTIARRTGVPVQLHRYLTEDTPEHFTFGPVVFITDPDAPRMGTATISLSWGDELPAELADNTPLPCGALA